MNPVRSRDRFANKLNTNQMHSRYNKINPQTLADRDLLLTG